MPNQVARDSGVDKKHLLKPFDPTEFGGPNDPCFGIHHSLAAEECQICGDIEICAIATMQNLAKNRLALEAENKYKDLEEADMLKVRAIKDFITEKKSQGLGDTVIRVKLKKKFNLTYSQTKLYLK